jgi:hypothetical protein
MEASGAAHEAEFSYLVAGQQVFPFPKAMI